MNAATSVIPQPGSDAATLQFGSATPYPAPDLPVRLTVAPPSSWGRITGTVSGRSCSGTTTPLSGITVQIGGQRGLWFPETASNGRYSLWLDKSNGTATVILGPSGWQPQYARVTVVPHVTTTRNFTLAQVGSCS